MDATLKRRMWKVAAAHFALSVIIYFLYPIILSGGTPSDLIWAFWHGALTLLQPQMFSPLAVFVDRLLTALLEATKVSYQNSVVILLWVSVPVWSLCFGWIFIRVKDWLSHFPALGRKIF